MSTAGKKEGRLLASMIVLRIRIGSREKVQAGAVY